jgi:hypothetical protein
VTVGIHPYTWAQLFMDAAAVLQFEEVAFRRSVAPRVMHIDDPAALASTAAQLITRLTDGDLLARVAHERAAHARGPRRIPIRGGFARLADPPSISPTTIVRAPLADGIDTQLEDDELLLTTAEKTISMPRFAQPQIEALLSGSPTCAAALPAGLDEAGKLVLVQRLVAEGLLVPDDENSIGLY